jgi:hypothetical protein
MIESREKEKENNGMILQTGGEGACKKEGAKCVEKNDELHWAQKRLQIFLVQKDPL